MTWFYVYKTLKIPQGSTARNNKPSEVAGQKISIKLCASAQNEQPKKEGRKIVHKNGIRRGISVSLTRRKKVTHRNPQNMEELKKAK